MATTGNVLCTLAVTSSTEALLDETVDLSLLEFILLYLVLAARPDYKSILQNPNDGSSPPPDTSRIGLLGDLFAGKH